MKVNNTEKQSRAYIGVDLGDKKHAVCVTDNDGNILKEFSIPNRHEDLEELAKEYPGATIAIEVGTHSPWISRLLTASGMTVVVANARKLRAIYQNDRKCDALDAKMLAKLVRVDAELLSPIKHCSEQAQKALFVIKLRDSLVRRRVHLIASIRGIFKSVGLRVPSSGTPTFHKKMRAFLEEHPDFKSTVSPSINALESITAEIAQYDAEIAQAAGKEYCEAARLQQIPSIGPVTSLTYVLTIEDPKRFEDARDVGAFLGLVPKRDQSGDMDKQLPITKSGNSYLRRLLVQNAQYLIGHYGPDCELRRFGLRLAARGGRAAKKKAVIAVARKLAVMMMAMWQKGTDFEPFPGGVPQTDAAEAVAA